MRDMRYFLARYKKARVSTNSLVQAEWEKPREIRIRHAFGEDAPRVAKSPSTADHRLVSVRKLIK